MNALIQPWVPRHRVTVADYHRMAEAGVLHEDDRIELIEGEIVDMAPIGSRHASAVNRLIALLQATAGGAAIVSSQAPVRLSMHSEPQPDLALLKPRSDWYASAHPGPQDVLLIIEVAESSLRYDREIKVPLYARYRIPEVWLVDLENRHLEVYRSPEADGYSEQLTLEALRELAPVLLPGCLVDLSGLFG